MKVNKLQPNLFGTEKFRVVPTPGKPQRPRQSLEDFTANVQEVANSRRGDTHARNAFHSSMEEPQPKWLHRTRLEKLVLLRAKYARHLAILETAGILDEVLQTEYTADTIPQIVAKVQEARRTGMKLDPTIEEELKANEDKIKYWLALRKYNR